MACHKQRIYANFTIPELDTALINEIHPTMKTCNSKTIGQILSIALILVGTRAFAQTPPGGAYPPGGPSAPGAVLGSKVIVASTGDVTATFVTGSGAFSDFLYLDNPGSAWANNGLGVSGNWIFENHESVGGQTVDLGTFTAGTELLFQVVADTTGNDYIQGNYSGVDNGAVYNWYSGPGSRNADTFAHNFVDSADFTPPLVGFEDLPGTPGYPGPGDANYEDIQYNFSNVVAVSAPDVASTIALLGMSMTALAAARRRFGKMIQ